MFSVDLLKRNRKIYHSVTVLIYETGLTVVSVTPVHAVHISEATDSFRLCITVQDVAF
jgi:hypothetical protein